MDQWKLSLTWWRGCTWVCHRVRLHATWVWLCCAVSVPYHISQTPHVWLSRFSNLAGLETLCVELSVKPWWLCASWPCPTDPSICPLTITVTSHTPGNMSEPIWNNIQEKIESGKQLLSLSSLQRCTFNVRFTEHVGCSYNICLCFALIQTNVGKASRADEYECWCHLLWK